MGLSPSRRAAAARGAERSAAASTTARSIRSASPDSRDSAASCSAASTWASTPGRAPAPSRAPSAVRRSVSSGVPSIAGHEAGHEARSAFQTLPGMLRRGSSQCSASSPWASSRISFSRSATRCSVPRSQRGERAPHGRLRRRRLSNLAQSGSSGASRGSSATQAATWVVSLKSGSRSDAPAASRWYRPSTAAWFALASKLRKCRCRRRWRRHSSAPAPPLGAGATAATQRFVCPVRVDVARAKSGPGQRGRIGRCALSLIRISCILASNLAFYSERPPFGEGLAISPNGGYGPATS